MKGITEKFFKNKRRINFTFKWYENKKIKSKWVAMITSDLIELNIINGILQSVSPTSKISDEWFSKASVGDEQKIFLTDEAKRTILLSLPKCPPKGRNILTKELKEMSIKKVEGGFVFIYFMEVIVEL